ncbi:hypothetical protein V6N12_058584 [Hibiscus sabdariffa]|uniref:Uncharacterized protein n=1 Tax=Hibiscus sabdariffa TaxID=183260 RepID=A0ABR2EUE6_9ROSI
MIDEKSLMREEFINVVAETTLLEFVIDVTKIIPITPMFLYLRKPSGQHEAFFPKKTQLTIRMKFSPLQKLTKAQQVAKELKKARDENVDVITMANLRVLEAAKDETEKIAFEANQQLAKFEDFLERYEHTIVGIQDSTIIPPGEQVLISVTIINDSTGDPSMVDVGGYVMDSAEKSAHVATTFLESFTMILHPLVL